MLAILSPGIYGLKRIKIGNRKFEWTVCGRLQAQKTLYILDTTVQFSKHFFVSLFIDATANRREYYSIATHG